MNNAESFETEDMACCEDDAPGGSRSASCCGDGTLDEALSHEVTACIARAVGSLFYAIYHIWMEDLTYVCFREDLKSILPVIGVRGDAVESWRKYIDGYIVPEDREAIRAFADFDTLADRLSDTNVVEAEYRRLGIGWTRGQFMVSRRDENGRASHVIYVVTDINAEKELAAKERIASYSSHHDALTGAFNRAAFDEMVANSIYAGGPVGFALVDVDNFKYINDERGHGFGDETLSKVAAALTSVFRADDLVFRIGGDEFAVIMKGCGSEIWGTVCEKFERIHRSLSASIADGCDVTLSAGVCFGASGYEDWMFDAADKGLYHTKERGRAGCTLVQEGGAIIESWRDDKASVSSRLALRSSGAGTCRIELPIDESLRPRLFCEDSMSMIFGMPEGLSPEERFDYWKSGIDPSCVDVVWEARREMLSHGNVEFTFRWGRRGEKPFLVRAVGSGRVEGGTEVLVGIQRSLEGARIIGSKDDADLIAEAREAVYETSYYVDIEGDRITILKEAASVSAVDKTGLSARGALNRLVDELVDGSCMQKVKGFTDLTSLPERLGSESSLECDFMGANGDWCRASWLPVRRGDSGLVTDALFVVASLDAAKQAEIASAREAAETMELYYEAAESMLGTKILSMALFDKSTGKGRAWTRTRGFAKPFPVSYNELVQSDALHVAPNGIERFCADIAWERVIATVSEKGRYEITAQFPSSSGSERFITYHFINYSRDPKLVFAVMEDSTFLHEQEGRSVEDLYDNAPGGLVSYEWADGSLKVLHVSKSYRTTFGEASLPLPDVRSTENNRIHPDDVAGYMREVPEALLERNEAHHVCRIWMPAYEDYAWVKIDAIAKVQPDGRAIVYAMYSEVSEMMEAKLGLAKTSESLEAALKTANQMIWEYYPAEHVAICFTEENAFGLPKRIEGYPESLGRFDVFVPEDSKVFSDTVRLIDEGAESAECTTRIRVDGEEHWFSCKFFARFDPILGKRTATLFVTDVNVRVAALKAFEDRLDSLLSSNEDFLATGVYNITKDEVLGLYTNEGEMPSVLVPRQYGEALEMVAQGIEDPAAREEYLQRFSRKSLLEMADSGEKPAPFECLFQMTSGKKEWIQMSVELVSNPINGEVEAVTFSKSINELKLSNLFIRQSLRRSYNSSAILFDDGDEYYLYDAMRGSICENHVDYWGDLAMVLQAICDAGEYERVNSVITKQAVLAKLEMGEEFSLAFDGSFYGMNRRLEIWFSKVDDQQGVIFASMMDITDGAMLKKLRHDALFDPLTGLRNRNATFSRCERLLRDNPEETFVMLKLNVRRFRLYNSFFGEEAGDELLKEVARQMDEVLGCYPETAYGRIEADVFCAFFPISKISLEGFIGAVESRFASYRDDFPLEAFIGIYLVADSELSAEEMFARATSAAKEGGKKLTRYASLYDDDLQRKLDVEVAIASEMQSALDSEQFAVYLQPKYDLQRKIVGAEALVRWIHPTRGIVSPAAFIPLFEKNGFISTLDRYIWEHVCMLLRKWLDEGREVKPVSVNVSRVSAYSPTTVPFLIDLVKRYDVDPALLELELTESVYIDDPEDIRRSMRTLQAAGFHILMDDFGSGYSSLNMLRNLPVDVLKLDMGFIAGANDEERGRTVVSSILDMTKKLDLPVIAEGVEMEDQAEFLRAAGCEYAQGYLFARPMPVEEYEKLV